MKYQIKSSAVLVSLVILSACSGEGDGQRVISSPNVRAAQNISTSNSARQEESAFDALEKMNKAAAAESQALEAAQRAEATAQKDKDRAAQEAAEIRRMAHEKAMNEMNLKAEKDAKFEENVTALTTMFMLTNSLHPDPCAHVNVGAAINSFGKSLKEAGATTDAAEQKLNEEAAKAPTPAPETKPAPPEGETRPVVPASSDVPANGNSQTPAGGNAENPLPPPPASSPAGTGKPADKAAAKPSGDQIDKLVKAFEKEAKKHI